MADGSGIEGLQTASLGGGSETGLAVRQEPPLRGRLGGSDLGVTNLRDVLEFAEMMSQADFMIPDHLQGNKGACAGVVMQALRWKMDPFAVAQQTYITASKEKIDGRETGRVIKRLAYMSAVIAAVVNTRAPIEGNIDYRHEGTGNQRKCVAFVVTKTGEMKEAETPELGKIPDFNKRSPLWKSNPDQQLAYLAAKLLARRHFPEILMGVATEDDDVSEPIDVTPRETVRRDTSIAPVERRPVAQVSAQETPSGVVLQANANVEIDDKERQDTQAGPAASEEGQAAVEAVQADVATAGASEADGAQTIERGVREPVRVARIDKGVEVRIRRLCGQARSTKNFAGCRDTAKESFEGRALDVALRALQLEETRSGIHPNRFNKLMGLIEAAKTSEKPADAFEALKARSKQLAGDGTITETERDIYLLDIWFGEVDVYLAAMETRQAA